MIPGIIYYLQKVWNFGFFTISFFIKFIKTLQILMASKKWFRYCTERYIFVDSIILNNIRITLLKMNFKYWKCNPIITSPRAEDSLSCPIQKWDLTRPLSGFLVYSFESKI